MGVYSRKGDKNYQYATVSPYVSIILSAKILTLLAGGQKDFTEIIKYAIILVVLNFILTLVGNGVAQTYDVLNYGLMKVIVQDVARKSWTMDYEKLGDSEERAKRESMSQWVYENGVMQIPNLYNGLLQNIFTIAISLSLAISFFTSKAVGDSDMVRFLNGAGLPIVLCIGFIIVCVYQIWEGGVNMQVNGKRWEAIGPFLNERDFIMSACARSYEDGKDIRLFKLSDYLKRRDIELCDKMIGISKKFYNQQTLRDTIDNFLVRAFTVLVFLMVGLKALNGAFEVGNLLLYTGIVTQLSTSMIQLGSILKTAKVNVEYTKKFFNYMDEPNSTASGKLPVTEDVINNYKFEFKDVTFTYPGTDKPSISHVNCTFRKGERIAVVGRNGSGKSTMIKLLCRLYEPTEGEILLNGVNIKEYDYESYQRLFAPVFQDYKIFAFTIAENVAPVSDRDYAKLEDVLDKAGFGEKLKNLPKGLDTMAFKNMGDFQHEDGVEFSGGEKQKLAIARSLYKDAPFAILDEPTAALDPLSEADIYKSMDKAVGNKGAIFISHRLSSCHFCDRIYVLDKGKLVENDTHEKLLELNGLYNKMWNAQAQYYV